MKIGVYLFTGAPVDIHSVMGHLFSKTCSFAASFTSHGGFSFLLSASLSPVPYYHSFFHPHFNCGRNCGATSNIIRSCFWGRGYPIGTGGASLLLEASSYGKLFQSLRRCSAVHMAWGSSATRLSGFLPLPIFPHRVPYDGANGCVRHADFSQLLQKT